MCLTNFLFIHFSSRTLHCKAPYLRLPSTAHPTRCRGRKFLHRQSPGYRHQAKKILRLPFRRPPKNYLAKKVRQKAEFRFSGHQVTESPKRFHSVSEFRKCFRCTARSQAIRAASTGTRFTKSLPTKSVSRRRSKTRTLTT
jgi:hypothetical protein